MGSILSKGALFPAQLTNEMINLVRGKSSLAALSGASPVPFNGETVFTFSMDSEADLVAENGAKSNGGATIGTPARSFFSVRSSSARFATDTISS